VPFCRGAISAGEIKQPENSESVVEHENAGDDAVACVRLMNYKVCQCERLENACISEGLFNPPKYQFAIPSWFPFNLLRTSSILYIQWQD